MEFLNNNFNFFYRIATDLINIRKETASTAFEEDSKSLFDIYLTNPDLDVKDITSMACDFLLAGVHTTSYSVGFLLYNIANNKRVQDLLFREVKEILPNSDDPITANLLNSKFIMISLINFIKQHKILN